MEYLYAKYNFKFQTTATLNLQSVMQCMFMIYNHIKFYYVPSKQKGKYRYCLLPLLFEFCSVLYNSRVSNGAGICVPSPDDVFSSI
jgi:hypothetical protein